MPSLFVISSRLGLNTAILPVITRLGLITVRPRSWTSHDDARLAARARTQSTTD